MIIFFEVKGKAPQIETKLLSKLRSFVRNKPTLANKLRNKEITLREQVDFTITNQIANFLPVNSRDVENAI